MPRTAPWPPFGGALVALSLLACSHASPAPPVDAGSGCPNDLPTACPTPPPSYKDDVAGILDAHCNGCHGPGGNAADKPLLTYADAFRLRGPVLNQVYGCVMPPATERPLTPEQRQKLLAWLVCGAPND
ncbi:MAG: hypothetical protein NVSMB47_11270 [Polyangiales bacterium]